MKIVMTLLTRNEDDILEDNINYHLSQGIDFIIAMNHKSNDRTSDILNKFSDEGQLLHLSKNEDQYSQALWVSEMARMAKTEYGADWVINNDTDEFWYAEGMNIKEYLSALPEKATHVHVDRYDFHYMPFEGKFYDHLIYREAKRLWTKCCHKAAGDVKIEMGNHHAYSDSFSDGVEIARDPKLKIFHFPLRSVEKYKERIQERVKDVENTSGLPPGAAFHWYNIENYIKTGNYGLYSDSKTYSNERIKEEIRNGITVFDDSLKIYFNKNLGRCSSVDRAFDL